MREREEFTDNLVFWLADEKAKNSDLLGKTEQIAPKAIYSLRVYFKWKNAKKHTKDMECDAARRRTASHFRLNTGMLALCAVQWDSTAEQH